MDTVNLVYLVLSAAGALFACVYSVKQITDGIRRRWLEEQRNTEAVQANTQAVFELTTEVRGIKTVLNDHDSRLHDHDGQIECLNSRFEHLERGNS